MKYAARHIRRFLESGTIDATLWKNHFPAILPSHVPSCEECSEFRERTCAGGRDPVDCFLEKTPEHGLAGSPKQKKRDPMLGLGSKEPAAHGTAKPRDQSKM